jgi:two-component system, chemotaxis family, sensor kinase CheA
MDAQKDLYREEAYELLAALEGALLELEERPEDMEVVGRVFRSMHTIKGSGAMFGFDDIASFTHTIETVYDMVREGKLSVTQDLISLTLSSCDQVKAMLNASRDGDSVDEGRTKELTEAFKSYLPREDAAEAIPAGEPKPVETAGDAGAMMTYRIGFKPLPHIFNNGTNPVLLLQELKGMGECSVVCQMQDLPDLPEIDPEACYTNWDIILTTACEINEIRDIFIFVEDSCELSIQPIDRMPVAIAAEEEGVQYKKVGEILVERGDIHEEDLEKALSSQKRIGEVLVEAGAVERSKVKSALMEQEHVRNMRKKHLSTDEASSIRVPSVKLDTLVNLVGELVTVQARLSQFSSRNNDPDLVSIAEEVEHLSSELRDVAMGIRMLPIGTIFAKFKRLVRDLSAELGKGISFITNGEETELDKTVIDKLSDPLVHLIRNSIDHGIESPDTRKASGKEQQGTIHLSAEHSGAYVLISVRDDGGGLDTQAIRNKAVEKGLISPDATLSDKEIYELILTPGFSTAKNITSVSGRGVGMDVVRSSIESFGGMVEIMSTKGKGTTITLKLPLTLAIIDGLLVDIAAESFVVPLGTVVECVELTASDISHAHGRHLINVREEIIPYIYLREFFKANGKRPDIEQVVITDLAGKRVGFVVDKVIGQHQTVIKNLGSVFKATEGISGATILGDGSVALILDINKLVHQVETQEFEYCMKDSSK